jgi:putative FmdB family regulatory protein
MPLYEYQCDACGHRFEVIRKFSDTPLDVCPRCGGAVKKLQSASSFHLKGSGWYITDYARKDQSGGEQKSEQSEEGKTAGDKGGDAESSKTDAKTDAKTETKAETKAETPKSEGGRQKSEGGRQKSEGGRQKSDT